MHINITQYLMYLLMIPFIICIVDSLNDFFLFPCDFKYVYVNRKPPVKKKVSTESVALLSTCVKKSSVIRYAITLLAIRTVLF